MVETVSGKRTSHVLLFVLPVVTAAVTFLLCVQYFGSPGKRSYGDPELHRTVREMQNHLEAAGIRNRGCADDDKITRGLRRLMKIANRADADHALLSLLSDTRISEMGRLRIWDCFFDRFANAWKENLFLFIEPADQFSRVAKCSLLVLSGRFKKMSELLDYYDSDCPGITYGDSMVQNTFILLKNEHTLKHAITEGRKSLQEEEKLRKYDRIAEEILQRWPE